MICFSSLFNRILELFQKDEEEQERECWSKNSPVQVRKKKFFFHRTKWKFSMNYECCRNRRWLSGTTCSTISLIFHSIISKRSIEHFASNIFFNVFSILTSFIHLRSEMGLFYAKTGKDFANRGNFELRFYLFLWEIDFTLESQG